MLIFMTLLFRKGLIKLASELQIYKVFLDLQRMVSEACEIRRHYLP